MNKYLRHITKSSNLSEILYKSFYSFSFRVFGFIVGFAFVKLITSHLGAEGQGYYAIIYMLVSLFAMFGKMGIDISMNKWCGIYNGSGDTNYLRRMYFRSLALIFSGSILSALVLFLIRDWVIAYFKDDLLLNGLLIVIVLLPFLTILDLNASFFRGLKKINWFGIYNQVGKFLLPLIVLYVLIVNNDLSIISPVKALFIGIVLLSFFTIIHIILFLKNLPQTEEKIPILSRKEILDTTLPMMLASSIIFVMGWIDTFIIGRMDTQANVGIYNVCVKLAVAISFIYNAVANITTTKISEFYSLNAIEKIRETIQFSNRINVFFAIPVFLILFIFPSPILGFFGPEFLDGIFVLRILLFSQLINSFLGNVSPFMQMTGSQKKLQFFIFIGLLINVAISLVLYQIIGIKGVAIGTLTASTTWRFLGVYYIYKTNNIKIWFQL
ncbi:MAG: MATE family efflux transporter [Bacteroidota bacterium]